MNTRAICWVCATCILMPILILAQETGANQPISVPLVKSGQGDLATAMSMPQDKSKPPYDQAPEAKTTVQPKYPDLATKAGIEGTVWTSVAIDDQGKVTKVTVTKSDAEIFNQVSIDAAMKWEFKPALKDGKAIACEVSIPFRFKIQAASMSDYSQTGLAPLFVAVTPRSGYRATRQRPYLIGQGMTSVRDWYPESAIRDKFEGIVILKLTVSLYGTVERVEVTGHARQDLDSAAVKLARTWTFIPGQANGMPERCVIQVPVDFYLGQVKN